MDSAARGLIVVGGLLVTGLAVDAVARKTRLPRISLLVAVGVLVGQIGLDLLTEDAERWFPTIAAVAVAMVGFLSSEGNSLSPISGATVDPWSSWRLLKP